MLTLLPLLVSCKPPAESTTTTPPVTTDTEDTDIVVIDDTAPEIIDDTAPPVPTGTPVTDTFTYVVPLVDLLFVLDASNSMVSKTETLIASLGGLVQDFDDKGLDYHIGVTNIDESPSHGVLEQVGGDRWASDDNPAPVSLLVSLVEAVGDPSSLESGRSAAYKALQLTDDMAEPNYGFVRDTSQLAVVVHTDETDQSGDVPISSADFIGYMQGLRPPGDVAFHSIAATSDYLDVTTSVGGIGWSVDNTPYGPALQAIADHFHGMRLVLTQPAIPGTFEIKVTEPDQSERTLSGSDYTFDALEGVIELVDDLPEADATIEILYLTPI